jgi:NAD(P)-dependent dehydrogenase (short-subunit alcohol dehydrogenase family)
MLLNNKNAIIYGGAGAVGGTVARAFARAGAKVFLAGRTAATLDKVVRSIAEAGGKAEAAVVDALDKEAVEAHLAKVVGQSGHIDISFNAISIDDVQGAPLTAMEADLFALPVGNAVRTHFITATAAARYMQRQGGGVILAITANAGRKPYLDVGGFGVACAAIEGLCRQLAMEEGKWGTRVVVLRSAGSPDAPGVDHVFKQHAANAGITREAFESEFAERTMLKRLPRLQEVANAAVLMAASEASAITAAVLNISCGELAD